MGPVGRVLRFLLGGYLFLLSVPYYLFPGRSVSFMGSAYSSDYASVSLALATTFGLFAFYLLVHRASVTYFRNLNRWLGAALANLPLIAIFSISVFFGLGFSQIAVLTYVGVAMLLAGWRKDQGCEVLSPANIVMGRHSHFACIVFSPIDWVEKKTRHSFRSGRANILRPQLKF
jgi:hypothetical protein